MPQQTSGKTVAELIVSARYDVDDSEPTYAFGDEKLLDWFLRGRDKIAKDGHAFQETEQVDMTTDLEYTPTTDYIKVVAVHYIDSSSNRKALLPGSPNAVGREYGSVVPNYYYEFNGKIGVYPQLSSVTDEKIILYLAVMPTGTLTTESTVDSPAIFDDALVAYIASKHFYADRKYSSAAAAMQEFEDIVARARVELQETEK